MTKKFNVTGLCIPEEHYMVNIENKLAAIKELIADGHYFTINRPRQYGKTTTLFMLERKLPPDKYLVISTSFEGIGDAIFEKEDYFCREFTEILAENIYYYNEELAGQVEKRSEDVVNFRDLSKVITYLCRKANKKIVLMIDEVDKSSNNQLFLSFLGLLRNKYLEQKKKKDYTFYSVILAGVHDIKNLKLKIRPEEERKLNSPWNIAINFEVKMSFSADEIETMLNEYQEDRGIEFNKQRIAEQIYYYTFGYPFLVSKICQIIDEKIISQREDKSWQLEDVDQAAQELIVKSRSTNFDSLIKNLENNRELYELVFELVIDGKDKGYNLDNPAINQGELYGIFRNEDGRLKINNRIYEQRIYNYMSSKLELTTNMENYNYRDNLISDDGTLKMKEVLLKFQQFMKEQYSKKDEAFLERNGRLLFLAFIRPVINGRGFAFKEVQISEERRLDVVITFDNQRYVVELKLWRGEKAHQRGLKQLNVYLDNLNQDQGFLVIYDIRKKNKVWKQEDIRFGDKNIFFIWV